MAVGHFRHKDGKPKKPKALFIPEPSSSGVDPKRLAAGLRAQGQIRTVDAAGHRWSPRPGGMPAPFCNVVLEVHLDGEPPYAATCQQSIPGMKLSQVQVSVRSSPSR